MYPNLPDEPPSRRELLRSAVGIAAASAIGWSGPALAQSDSSVATKAIPHTGERLPVIGLGTANEFQRQVQGDDKARLKQVVGDLLASGCKLIDTASCYGQAEAVLGDLLSDQDRAKVFLATKIESGNRREGLAEFRRSLERLRYRQVDLLQLHNVQDPQSGPCAVSRLEGAGALPLCRHHHDLQERL